MAEGSGSQFGLGLPFLPLTTAPPRQLDGQAYPVRLFTLEPAGSIYLAGVFHETFQTPGAPASRFLFLQPSCGSLLFAGSQGQVGASNPPTQGIIRSRRSFFRKCQGSLEY